MAEQLVGGGGPYREFRTGTPLRTHMTNILRAKNFDYYMNHAEQRCQDALVETIWQAPRKFF